VVPLFSEESAVETGEEGAYPEDEEDVCEIVVGALAVVLYSDGHAEDEADEEGSPEIPVPQFPDGGLPISGDHEEGVLDLGANAEDLPFLGGGIGTRVSQES